MTWVSKQAIALALVFLLGGGCSRSDEAPPESLLYTEMDRPTVDWTLDNAPYANSRAYYGLPTDPGFLPPPTEDGVWAFLTSSEREHFAAEIAAYEGREEWIAEQQAADDGYVSAERLLRSLMRFHTVAYVTAGSPAAGRLSTEPDLTIVKVDWTRDELTQAHVFVLSKRFDISDTTLLVEVDEYRGGLRIVWSHLSTEHERRSVIADFEHLVLDQSIAPIPQGE